MIMTLEVPDQILKKLGATEGEARIEIACRLYEVGKLTLHEAAQFSGLDRNGIEDALLQRRIPIYRYGVEDLEKDLRTLDEMGV
jgi:predicted HTH domain antitoxin